MDANHLVAGSGWLPNNLVRRQAGPRSNQDYCPARNFYDHCERDGVRMYGGGMGELGVARAAVAAAVALAGEIR
jgi:hypothetical protein